MPLQEDDVIRLKNGQFARVMSHDSTHMNVSCEDGLARHLPITEFVELVMPADAKKLEDTQEFPAVRK